MQQFKKTYFNKNYFDLGTIWIDITTRDEYIAVSHQDRGTIFEDYPQVKTAPYPLGEELISSIKNLEEKNNNN